MKILLTSRNHLYSKDYVLPAGNLREPRSGSGRANCIVVTGCEPGMNAVGKSQVINSIQPLERQPVFFSSLIYGDPVQFFNATEISLTELSERNVILFAGIANPESLEKMVASYAHAMESFRFSDHHVFTIRDMDAIKEKFDKFTRKETIILTTEKDYSRLKGTPVIEELKNLPCYYIPVRVNMDKEEAFNSIIKNYVAKNKGNS